LKKGTFNLGEAQGGLGQKLKKKSRKNASSEGGGWAGKEEREEINKNIKIRPEKQRPGGVKQAKAKWFIKGDWWGTASECP